MSIFTKIKEFFLGKPDTLEPAPVATPPAVGEPVAVPRSEAIAPAPVPPPAAPEPKVEDVEVGAPVAVHAEQSNPKAKAPAKPRAKKPEDNWPFPKTPPKEGKQAPTKPAAKAATKPAAPKKPRAPKPKQ